MAWEQRGDGRYYYRSVRDGEKVRKEYVGAGELAETSARTDEAIRRARAERRERGRAQVDGARELVEMGGALDAAAEILARAEMVAAGLHRHKGEWRRRRDA